MKPITHTNKHMRLVEGYQPFSGEVFWTFTIPGDKIGPFVSRNTEFEMPRSSHIYTCLADCLKGALGVEEKELSWHDAIARMDALIGVGWPSWRVAGMLQNPDATD